MFGVLMFMINYIDSIKIRYFYLRSLPGEQNNDYNTSEKKRNTKNIGHVLSWIINENNHEINLEIVYHFNFCFNFVSRS